LVRLEKIEDEVRNVGDAVGRSQNISVQMKGLQENIDSLNASVSRNHSVLERRLNEISVKSVLVEKRLSKEIEDAYQKVIDEMKAIDSKIEKNLNMTEEMEGPAVNIESAIKRFNSQLKKIEAAADKIFKILSKKDFDAPKDSASCIAEWSDRFIIIFSVSIVGAVILTALLSAFVSFCIYRLWLRQRSDTLSDNYIRQRAIQYGRERRPNIIHPHNFPVDNNDGQVDDGNMQRTQAYVDEIERRRRNNETIESDPLNIDRVDRVYDEIQDSNDQVAGASGGLRRPYVSPLRRLLCKVGEATSPNEIKMETRRTFLAATPASPTCPPPPPPRINPPLPEMPTPISPPDLGLKRAPLQDLSDL
jgi:hypothetical protein